MADSETQQVTSKTYAKDATLGNAIFEILSAATKISADEREFITNLPALVVTIIASIPASWDTREFKKNFSFSIDSIVAST